MILSEEEKHGGLPFTNAKSVGFANVITRYDVVELKFLDSSYTWWNGRIEKDCIFKRLGRVLVNQEYLISFHLVWFKI